MLPERNITYRHLAAEFDSEDSAMVREAIRFLKTSKPDDFESAARWFGYFQELSDAVNEAQTRLDLLISLNNQNAEYVERVQKFERDILAQLIEARAELMDIYLASSWRGSMHPDDRGKIHSEILLRRKFASVDLGPLQIEENQLVRDFKNFSANTTCLYFGRQTPIGIVIGKLNDPRPEIRKEAFYSHWRCIKESQEWLEDLFTRLLKNRIQQAKVSGASSYIELCFSDLGRFDYTAADCSTFRKSIMNEITPLVRNLQSRQLLSLGTPTLKPWDMNIWPRFIPNEPPAQGDVGEIINAAGRIVEKIHPGFGVFYRKLIERKCIDVHPRNHKSPGAFCVVLPESGTPFIFGNFAGHFRDAFTLLHEFGHALHGSSSLQIRNTLLRHPGLEFCEVASMGMEFLAQPFLNEFWPRTGDSARAWGLHCFNALQFWPFMAMLDEWQHTVYAQELLDPDDRNALWKELNSRYRPGVDWTDAEEFEELGWISRPHPMTSPFYYIDYGIAQLGAVELWMKSGSSYPKAVQNYIDGLSLGAQRTLPQLFEATELKFDFSQKWVGTLGRVLFDEIESLL
ncbi:MAG: M3 family metallopeptidase [Silvanigrellaceae bacterium]